MPELPDVEVFRRYLDATSLHQKIQNVDIFEKDMADDISARSLQIRLKDRQLTSTLRHGKYLFCETDSQEWLVLHFGMTGFLKYFKNQDEKPDHTRMLINFTNGYHLAYDNQRKLGLFGLVKDIEEYIHKKGLGVDPYRSDLDYKTFRKYASNSRGTIKHLLMDQKTISGIGNIYSDEILFHSGVHPNSKSNELNDDLLKKIHKTMKNVFDTAIESKADPTKLPDDYLILHRKPDDNCPQCEGKIKKEQISGRSSYFCSKHQNLIN